MGISRDSRHKRRLTGGRRNVHKKCRKYEMGRVGANTKVRRYNELGDGVVCLFSHFLLVTSCLSLLSQLGAKRVRPVRCRGGNMKYVRP